jgi:hypothetical protein
LRKETGIKISDDIIVVFSFPEGSADKLSNVCVKYADYINKVLKVPFTCDKPTESGYSQHAIADYDIVTELEEKDTSKKEDEKPKEKLTKEQRKVIAKLNEDAKKEKDEKKETKKVEVPQGTSEKLKVTILKK